MYAKLGVIFLLVLLPFLTIKSCYVKNYDVNYYKASGKAKHLIVGLSRAKRGLAPSILKKELGLDGRLINFAFNNIESPYGKPYYEVIQKKVIRSEKNGLFILSVCPGAIMDMDRGNGVFGSREEQFFYYDLWCKNCQPNLEYIIKCPIRNGSLFQFLRNHWSGIFKTSKTEWPEIIHSDGWGELNPSMRYKRSRPIILERVFRKSTERELYLSKTIEFLQNYGTVVLVRLPVGAAYLEYEKELYPEFDTVMEKLASNHEVEYLNYVETRMAESFHDGHHLFGDEARIISLQLARDLKSKIVH